jgi:hypothetical protein
MPRLLPVFFSASAAFFRLLPSWLRYGLELKWTLSSIKSNCVSQGDERLTSSRARMCTWEMTTHIAATGDNHDYFSRSRRGCRGSF